MCTADSALLDVYYQQGDETVTKIRPAATEISG